MRCCLEFPQKSVDGSYKNILIILLKDKRIIKFSINTSSVSRCEPPSPSGEGEEVASLPVSGRLSICLPFKSSSPLNKNLPTENFLNYFQKSIDKRILLWYSITRTDRTRSALILFEIRRSTQVGRRGAPAKGVGRIFNRRESSNLSFSARKTTGFNLSSFFRYTGRRGCRPLPMLHGTSRAPSPTDKIYTLTDLQTKLCEFH